MELQHKILFVWRVSNYPNLKGHGGLIVEGRWHTKGHSIVYCADSVACALGEIEKHLDLPAVLFPPAYQVLKIKIPGSAKIYEFEADKLPDKWLSDYRLTQPIGDKWLGSVTTPVAKVPSALFAERFNYLINPTHRMSDFIEVIEVLPVGKFV